MAEVVSIGFGCVAFTRHIQAIVTPDSAPIKRLITEARAQGQLIDSTYGRRTRSVLITDTGKIILSAITPETIAARASGEDTASLRQKEQS